MKFEPLSSKDLLTIGDLSATELDRLLTTAAAFKRRPADFARALAGSSIVLLFEKPSLRTRVSFEVGIARLGGHGMFYDHSRDRIGVRESVKDYGLNLERWVHGIVARVFEQSVLAELARHTRVPVINALSNEHHPCQALADVLTLQERFGKVAGLRIVYVGDGNNVCVSLAQAATKLGAHFVAVGPSGHHPPPAAVESCRTFARQAGGTMTVTADIGAVKGADAVYTDEWVSMHQTGSADRLAAFRPYQVDSRLMAAASDRAIFMHCLPAVRGQEVTADVIDSPRSVVYDQAENRMHVQNAVLLHTVAAMG